MSATYFHYLNKNQQTANSIPLTLLQSYMSCEIRDSQHLSVTKTAEQKCLLLPHTSLRFSDHSILFYRVNERAYKFSLKWNFCFQLNTTPSVINKSERF